MLKYKLSEISLISKKIISRLDKGDTVYLSGELGSGKTTLARELINELQKKNDISLTEVPSPTFNILYEYMVNSFKIMHYDLYRIKDKLELNQLGIYENSDDVINIIEWPEKLEKQFKNRLEINIKYGTELEDRNIELIGFGKWRNFQLNEV